MKWQHLLLAGALTLGCSKSPVQTPEQPRAEPTQPPADEPTEADRWWGEGWDAPIPPRNNEPQTTPQPEATPLPEVSVPAYTPEAFIDQLPRTRCRYLLVDSLILNTFPHIRSIIFQDEQAGVRDQIELLRNEVLEEGWLYLPAHECWVEIANQSTLETTHDSYRRGLSFDDAYWFDMIERYDDLIHFHYHPNQIPSIQMIADHFREEGYPLTEEELERITTDKVTEHSLPSRSDYDSMITTSRRFYHYHPGGDYRYKLVSEYGVTEFRVPNGFDVEDRRYRVRGDLTSTLDGLIDVQRLTLAELRYLEPIERLQETIRVMNAQGLIHLYFTPHDS